MSRDSQRPGPSAAAATFLVTTLSTTASPSRLLQMHPLLKGQKEKLHPQPLKEASLRRTARTGGDQSNC